MTGIREGMPLLARHEGVWDGWYRYFDRDGNRMDEHRSRLICRFPDDGPYPYHQTNNYRWEDGRTEVRDFPAAYRDGRVWFDNELIQLSDCGRFRQRVWQWIRDGQIAQRTLIDEEKVSDEWRGATADSLP